MISETDRMMAAIADCDDPLHGEAIWRATEALRGLMKYAFDGSPKRARGLYDTSVKFVDMARSRDELLTELHQGILDRSGRA